MANNFVALVFTIVFAHLLGADGYGSLGALLAAFTILIVPGLRAAGHRGPRGQRRGRPRRGQPGRRGLALARAAHRGDGGVAASWGYCCASRSPRRSASTYEWAAAAMLPSGVLWLALCVQRGVLQGMRRYAVVGLSIIAEACARLGLGHRAVRGGARRHGGLSRHQRVDRADVAGAGPAALEDGGPLAVAHACR